VIIFEVGLPEFLQLTAELKFYEGADDSEVEEGVFGFVHEVGAVEILVGKFTDSNGH
jgi:hypothetical protein